MKIAITGGIGSGKSHVCQLLAGYGIKVYDCDTAAKRLMASSPPLQARLQELVGGGVYINKVLQKSVLAQYLLASDANKQAVDDVVHPAVAADFMASGLEWLESAILFDSGFYRRVSFDHVVCVSAPIEVRVERIVRRDNTTRERALQWIGRQMPQEQVERLSDFVVCNDGRSNVNQQIENILKQIKR